MIDSWIRYNRSKYDDIIDAIKYSASNDQRVLKSNGNLVDLNSLLVWNHDESEPIAKVTSCEIKPAIDRDLYLDVQAVTLSEEERSKIMSRYYSHKTTEIKKVIFSNPATIVFWADGSKTVVKAHNEDFDPEKGLAMAVCKRLYGDKYHYIFKQALKEYEERETVVKDFEGALAKTRETIKALAKELNAGKENK